MWSRIDDNYPDHPKVVAAGEAAAYLNIVGICYSSRHLTDGYIPAEQIPRMTVSKKRRELVQKLIDVGLWNEVPGGYQIHDYLDYHPGADAVRSQRAAGRERKAEAARKRKGLPVDSGRNPSGIPADSSRLPSDPYPYPYPYPSQAQPIPQTSPSETAQAPNNPSQDQGGIYGLGDHTPRSPVEWQEAMAQEMAKRDGNPLALLVAAITVLSPTPVVASDLYPRIGKMVKGMHSDYAYALKLVINAANEAPVGNFVNYLAAMVKNRKGGTAARGGQGKAAPSVDQLTEFLAHRGKLPREVSDA